MLDRLRGAIAWRAERLGELGYLRRHFRNWRELTNDFDRDVPCAEAILADGVRIRHPAGRTGFARMLLEVWHHEVYRIDEFLGAETGGAVVDAGANIGLFSLAVARRDPARRVVAFEPFAENFALLEANLAAAGARSVTAVRGALAGAAGTATLVDGGARSQDHRLEPGASGPGVSVPTHSFADALRMTGEESIALFKCDIEGSEHELFRDASDADLARVDAYSIEYHDNVRPGTVELLTRRLGPTHELDCRPAGGMAGWGMLYATSRRGR